MKKRLAGWSGPSEEQCAKRWCADPRWRNQSYGVSKWVQEGYNYPTWVESRNSDDGAPLLKTVDGDHRRFSHVCVQMCGMTDAVFPLMAAKLIESWAHPLGDVFEQLPLAFHARRDARIPETMPTWLVQFKTAKDARAALERGDCRHKTTRKSIRFVKSEREFDLVELYRRRHRGWVSGLGPVHRQYLGHVLLLRRGGEPSRAAHEAQAQHAEPVPVRTFRLHKGLAGEGERWRLRSLGISMLVWNHSNSKGFRLF